MRMPPLKVCTLIMGNSNSQMFLLETFIHLRVRAYSFGTSVFSRQQLNSEVSRLRRRSFPFPKEWVCRFRKVRRFQLKNEALKPSCHKENTSEKRGSQAKLSQRKHIRTRILSKSAKPSSRRSRRFRRPSKPTVYRRKYQKNRILKRTKNRRQPAEKRRCQKNTP